MGGNESQDPLSPAGASLAGIYDSDPAQALLRALSRMIRISNKGFAISRTKSQTVGLGTLNSVKLSRNAYGQAEISTHQSKLAGQPIMQVWDDEKSFVRSYGIA